MLWENFNTRRIYKGLCGTADVQQSSSSSEEEIIHFSPVINNAATVF